MSPDHYYQTQQAHLQEIARKVIRERPHLARFFYHGGNDPDARRLVEGGIWLAGALNYQRDEAFTQLTGSMVDMLMPGYQRAFPSTLILSFDVPPGTTPAESRIEKGAMVHGLPVHLSARSTEKSSLRCAFSTCRPVELLPVRLTGAASHQRTRITLRFQTDTPRSLRTLRLEKLRLYLGDEPYSGQQLYLWLSHYLAGATLQVGEQTFPLDRPGFTPVGFARDEALLPWPTNASIGQRLLLEYFSLPESFLFLDIAGLSGLPDIPCDSVTLHLDLARPLPADVRVAPESFRLHCTPAINLFARDSEMVRLDGSRNDYPLRPAQSHAEPLEIHAVNRVAGWCGGERQVYVPFEHFQHQVYHARGETVRYYHLLTRPLPAGGFEHGIAFVRGDERLQTGHIHISLSCSNRGLPLHLKTGQVNLPGRGVPEGVNPVNITRPTRPLTPPQGKELHKTLLSVMALNYNSLLDRSPLVQLFQSLDLPALHDRQMAHIARLLQNGVTGMDSFLTQRHYRDVPVRGMESTLHLKQKGAFSCEGELYLFGTLLSHFFAVQSSINAFHHLTVVNSDNRERYQWPLPWEDKQKERSRVAG